MPTADEKSVGTDGGQIDLLIDRADGVINVCEMKFYKEPFSVTSEYANKIRNRNAIFKEKEKCKKSLANTLVTMYDIIKNKNNDVFDNILLPAGKWHVRRQHFTVISTILYEDLPAVEEISYETIRKTERMLMILAEQVPQTPNMNELYIQLDTNRNSGMMYKTR